MVEEAQEISCIQMTYKSGIKIFHIYLILSNAEIISNHFILFLCLITSQILIHLVIDLIYTQHIHHIFIHLTLYHINYLLLLGQTVDNAV